MYVFDTSPISTLFKNYYRKRFPSLWANFDELVAEGKLVSTREVARELEDGPVESARNWAADQHDLFAVPTAAEAAIVAQIFGVAHFQQNIELQKLLRGGRNADPFVVARAHDQNRAVVTMELLKPNSAKIPNICAHFGVPCMTLEEFMEEEGWEF